VVGVSGGIVGGWRKTLRLIRLLEGRIVKDLLVRNFYRVSFNFAALVLIQMTISFLLGPIFYLGGLARWGWYSLELWQIKMMFTVPVTDVVNFAMLALLLIMFFEFMRAVWLALRGSYRLLRSIDVNY